MPGTPARAAYDQLRLLPQSHLDCLYRGPDGVSVLLGRIRGSQR
jgi:hypothetical protein